jgi:serine/threonine-protein kinase
MFGKSTSALYAISARRSSRVLIFATLALALTSTTVDSRRYGRYHYRQIERSIPAPESDAPGNFERGRFDGYRNRYLRRGLPTNITVLVPADWRKDPPDPNWRGHRYVAPEGDASIAFYGRPAVEQTRDQYLKALMIVEGEDVTYLRRERDWLVVFGSKGDKGERNFYRKVVLACGGQQWRHVALEYPAEAKRSFERLIERLSKVVDVTTDDGCDVGRPSAGAVALSAEQMRCVYDSVPKWAKTDLRIRLALGAEVPRNTKLFNFPGETFACNAKLANFRFIVVEDDVVIVDPADYSIVETISQ